MQFHKCSLEVKCEKSFTVTDEGFQKLFAAAVAKKPNLLSYLVDIDYDGVVAATRVNVTQKSTSGGGYSIKKISDSEYVLESDCKIDEELMFITEAGANAFKKALAENKLRVSIVSIGNEGETRETFWWMGCNPKLDLNSKEFSLS